ncbi:LysM peptidoglycan-binding domain-containing protein [Streptomyces sp. NPDC059037]
MKPGDTLTAISGTTGVSIGILAETNKIQNPDLIYAGASLLIPPV